MIFLIFIFNVVLFCVRCGEKQEHKNWGTLEENLAQRNVALRVVSHRSLKATSVWVLLENETLSA